MLRLGNSSGLSHEAPGGFDKRRRSASELGSTVSQLQQVVPELP